MSIRILPQEKIKDIAKTLQAVPLLFPNVNNIHSRRSERLRQLATDHPLKDYLNFVANLSDAQGQVLAQFKSNDKLTLTEDVLADKPLNVKQWKRDSSWIDILHALLEQVKGQENETIEATIDWLEKASNAELEKMADDVLMQNGNVTSDKALFLWAALSVYWLLLASRIPHTGIMDSGEYLYHCPVCGSEPSASIIHIGDNEGLRYLHCSLCETEWNMVRAKCSVCDQSGKLEYWLMDEQFPGVKAESCGDCNSYLKAFYQNQDVDIDVFADDLASIFLDAEMEEKGFSRSGPNPFLFIDEQ